MEVELYCPYCKSRQTIWIVMYGRGDKRMLFKCNNRECQKQLMEYSLKGFFPKFNRAMLVGAVEVFGRMAEKHEKENSDKSAMRYLKLQREMAIRMIEDLDRDEFRGQIIEAYDIGFEEEED